MILKVTNAKLVQDLFDYYQDDLVKAIKETKTKFDIGALSKVRHECYGRMMAQYNQVGSAYDKQIQVRYEN